MKWKSAIERALKELRTVEAGIASELTDVRQKLASLARLTGGIPAARKAGAKRKMSPEGRAAIVKAAKKRWAKHRAEKRAAGNKAS